MMTTAWPVKGLGPEANLQILDIGKRGSKRAGSLGSAKGRTLHYSLTTLGLPAEKVRNCEAGGAIR